MVADAKPSKFGHHKPTDGPPPHPFFVWLHSPEGKEALLQSIERAQQRRF